MARARPADDASLFPWSDVDLWLDVLRAPEGRVNHAVAALARALATPHAIDSVMLSNRLSGFAILVASRLDRHLAARPALLSTGRIARTRDALARVRDNPAADLHGALARLSASIPRLMKAEPGEAAALPRSWDTADSAQEKFWQALPGLAAWPQTAPFAASAVLEAYIHPPAWLAGPAPLAPAQEFFMEVDAALRRRARPVDWTRPATGCAGLSIQRQQANWLLALALGFAATNFWESPLASSAGSSNSPRQAAVAWLAGPAWEGVLHEAIDLANAERPAFHRIVQEMPSDLLPRNARMDHFDHVLDAATATAQASRLAAMPARDRSRRLA